MPLYYYERNNNTFLLAVIIIIILFLKNQSIRWSTKRSGRSTLEGIKPLILPRPGRVRVPTTKSLTDHPNLTSPHPYKSINPLFLR